MTFPAWNTTGSLRLPAALAVTAALVTAAAASGTGVHNLRVSPALPSSQDVVTLSFNVILGCNALTFEPVQVTGDHILITGNYPSEEDCPSSGSRAITLPIGPLPAGEYRLEVEIGPDVEVDPEPFATGDFALHIEPASERLLLRAGQQNFDIAVSWRNQHAEDAVGVGIPVRLSTVSGYFWFFHNEIAEVTVKILDGSPINGHFWLFLASMTDVETTVTVRKLTGSHCLDTGTCPTRVYTLAPGRVEGRVDLAAF